MSANPCYYQSIHLFFFILYLNPLNKAAVLSDVIFNYSRILIFFTFVLEVQNFQNEPHEIRCTSSVRFYVQVKHESVKITYCIEVSIDSDALDICEDIVEN